MSRRDVEEFDNEFDEELDEEEDLDEEDIDKKEDTGPKEPKDLAISIENVVASASLDQKIDLLAIVKVFLNVEYRPKQFPGLVFRLKRPKTATLIFGSGKMVCTGAKSEKMARSAVKKVVRELKNNGIIILGKPKIVIQNIVASANLHGKIDLETAADIMENVMYKPEQFPGLIYRMGEPKVVMLLFASGKLVCTGAKHEDMVREAVEKLHEILEDFDLIYYE
ncbi:MAG: TATA-box-binding protein [Candidatus Bathyarchaeota archaeon]